jgi:hypothetical protein
VQAVRAAWDARIAKRQRESDLLRDQLRNLYGPLDMLATVNGVIFEQQIALDSDSQTTFPYVGNSSNEAEKQRGINIGECFVVGNQYSDKLQENNKQIFLVLRDNWGFVDRKDIEKLRDIITHIVRLQVEFDGTTKPPIDVALKRPIFFWNREWETFIRARFLEKQKRLQEISSGAKNATVKS